MGFSRRRRDAPPQWEPRLIHLPTKRNRVNFWFCPPYPTEQPAKTRIAYNGPRVYEPEVRARRLRTASAVTEREGWATGQTRAGAAVGLCVPATAVTVRGMDRAPSDERSEERCVNPLLYAVRVFAFSPKT